MRILKIAIAFAALTLAPQTEAKVRIVGTIAPGTQYVKLTGPTPISTTRSRCWAGSECGSTGRSPATSLAMAKFTLPLMTPTETIYGTTMLAKAVQPCSPTSGSGM